jgi:hypothetical protein
LHHPAHQCHRLRRDFEGEAGGEPRHPQDAHRVLDESLADMAQHAALEVLRAPERVDQVALLVACDRVDGEVAPRQVLLQRHVRRGEHCEALVAAPGLALGAGERVFLVGLWMQEDREVLADRAETQPHHLFGIAAYHHVVMVLDRKAEQLVPDRAAYAIDLHTGCGSNAAMVSVSATAAATHSCRAGSARTASAYSRLTGLS